MSDADTRSARDVAAAATVLSDAKTHSASGAGSLAYAMAGLDARLRLPEGWVGLVRLTGPRLWILVAVGAGADHRKIAFPWILAA
jgi:hypothetical protein